VSEDLTEADRVICACFEQLFVDWRTLDLAVRTAAGVDVIEKLEVVLQDIEATFRGLWAEWDRARADDNDAAYALLRGAYDRDWIDAAERAGCLLETMQPVEDLTGETVFAAAAMAEENAYAWMAWILGTDAATLMNVRETWDHEGQPAEWRGVGFIGLQRLLEEERAAMAEIENGEQEE